MMRKRPVRRRKPVSGNWRGDEIKHVWKKWRQVVDDLDLFWSANDVPTDPDVKSHTGSRDDRLWRQARFNPRSLLRLASNPYLLHIPRRLQGSIPGPWLTVTRAGVSPARMYGLARPLLTLLISVDLNLTPSRTASWCGNLSHSNKNRLSLQFSHVNIPITK